MIYLSKKFKPKIGKYEEFIVKFYYDLTRGLLGLDWYDLGLVGHLPGDWNNGSESEILPSQFLFNNLNDRVLNALFPQIHPILDS